MLFGGGGGVGGVQEKYRGKWKPQVWGGMGHDGTTPVEVTHEDNEWGIEVCGSSEQQQQHEEDPSARGGGLGEGLKFR